MVGFGLKIFLRRTLSETQLDSSFQQPCYKGKSYNRYKTILKVGIFKIKKQTIRW